jgi:uncharacterized protein YtpQ (UPF0354 family)
MNNMNDPICSLAFPYFKQNLGNDTGEDLLTISEEDSVVSIEFNEDLIITFLAHDSEKELFKYIANRDLQSEQLDSASLLDTGISNLYSLAASNGLRIQELDEGCFALLLDGNFEASLILLDNLWNNTLKQYAPNGYAVAIPARDVLAFCDLHSNNGVERLKGVISSVWENGSYLLTDRIFNRTEGKWTYL